MNPFKTKLIKIALASLYYSQLYRLLEVTLKGMGLIFTLHRVRPFDVSVDFAPNRILEIDPDFLEQTIQLVLASGMEVISLDEVVDRLRGEGVGRGRRFACFTFDDGYLDNYEYAFPIFAKYDLPWTVYVTTGLIDRTATFWWLHLEAAISEVQKLEVQFADSSRTFDLRTTREKYAAFHAIYWKLRNASHAERYHVIDSISRQHDITASEVSEKHGMTWQMLDELAQSKLVAIGAHTKNHYSLADLSESEAIDEIEHAHTTLTRRLGKAPRHFAFPYGDTRSAGRREFGIAESLGYESAVTTQKGMLYPEHAARLFSLPRISLNGDYQSRHYARLFIGGAPFALSNGFRRVRSP